MNFSITARHFKLKDDLREYITSKSNKLSRYYDGIIDTEVILGWEKNTRLCELKINVNNKQIVLKEDSEDLRKSFDIAIDKAERQLKRYKSKARSVEKDVHDGA